MSFHYDGLRKSKLMGYSIYFTNVIYNEATYQKFYSNSIQQFIQLAVS